MSDHAFRPLGAAKPAASGGGRSRHAVSASAGAGRRRTLRPDASKRADPRREQRPSRSDCAARNSRAQGAPRCPRSAPPALRAAGGLDRASREPFLGNYRRPQRKCLTTVSGGATVGSSSLAATRSPLHIARCGARSNRRSQATVRSPLLNSLPGRLFVRRHVRETDDRIGLRFGPQARRRSDRAPHVDNRHAATAIRLSVVDASGAALSAPDSPRTNNGHRRSKWAGVSWPKDDDHERDAAGDTGLTLVRTTTDADDDGADDVASRVRSRAGAAGRTRVLRARTEAAIARRFNEVKS